jgi:hypothetical protein
MADGIVARASRRRPAREVLFPQVHNLIDTRARRPCHYGQSKAFLFRVFRVFRGSIRQSEVRYQRMGRTANQRELTRMRVKKFASIRVHSRLKQTTQFVSVPSVTSCRESAVRFCFYKFAT